MTPRRCRPSETNITRHARAGRAEAALETEGGTVRPTVTDNEVGIPAEGRRSGLADMAPRVPVTARGE
ncbi:hypothetical protein GCM10014715_06760 [Streptomyces spiralis]|uniref:Uncharacterized protein n=1 Tax=Streptomyces spiralis TaxID=66376 RepID=A0A918ZJQ9_9ACTN|nr:hypothetical protein GCM10014715_06760 [Streptomyces spiralis]